MTSRGQKDFFRMLYKIKIIKGKIDKFGFNKCLLIHHKVKQNVCSTYGRQRNSIKNI